jgi:hypothetical protein
VNARQICPIRELTKWAIEDTAFLCGQTFGMGPINWANDGQIYLFPISLLFSQPIGTALMDLTFGNLTIGNHYLY